MQLRSWLSGRTVVCALALALAAAASSGAGWEAQTSGARGELKDVFFTDLQNGWATGYDGLLRTTNGGASWTAQQEFRGRNGRRYYFAGGMAGGLYFANAQCGWAVGSSDVGGLVLRTRDGGAKWEAVEVPNSIGTKGGLVAVHFVDPLIGWAVGIYGVIMATKDGGRTWQQQGIGTTGQSLRAVHFVDAQRGWAVSNTNQSGQMMNLGGTLIQTTNGGATWTVVTTGGQGGGGTYDGLWFANPDCGWIGSGGGKILRTTDGAKSWTLVQSPGKSSSESVHFVDAMNGWAVGVNGMILRTSDGGVTWTAQKSPWGHFSAVHFVDAKNGWIVGDDGQILHTTTGGE